MTPERVSRRRSAALRTGNTDIVHNPAALEQRIINSIAEYRVSEIVRVIRLIVSHANEW
jgi:hypothetical protein